MTGRRCDPEGDWDPGWQVYPINWNQDQDADLFLDDPDRPIWVQALNHNGDGTFAQTVRSRSSGDR